MYHPGDPNAGYPYHPGPPPPSYQPYHHPGYQQSQYPPQPQPQPQSSSTPTEDVQFVRRDPQGQGQGQGQFQVPSAHPPQSERILRNPHQLRNLEESYDPSLPTYNATPIYHHPSQPVQVM
jgi:hypothetical protein